VFSLSAQTIVILCNGLCSPIYSTDLLDEYGAPVAATVEPTSRRSSLPPEVLFVVSAVSLYVGSGLAKDVFGVLSPIGTAWLRVLGGGLALCAWRRPWRLSWTRRTFGLAVVFGLATTAMNCCFYLAIDRIPIGTAVAIEFIGPVVVAATGLRTRRNVASLGLIVVGVAVLSGIEWNANFAGLVAIFLAAALWAAYIVLGSKIADGGAGLDGLAVGVLAGAVLLAPLGLASAGSGLGQSDLVVEGLLVGIFSTAIPYGLDQIVLQRLSPARFAQLLAILPVTAAVVGAVMLREIPGRWELVGMGFVVSALLLRDRTAS
jgi:inner membrane transporter RhtA